MCKYLQVMLFYSETKKIKYLLDPTPPPHPPPPPKKKRRRDTNGRDMAIDTHECLFIPAACDLDF